LTKHNALQYATSNGVSGLRDYAYVRVNQLGLPWTRPTCPLVSSSRNWTVSVQFSL